MTVDDKNKDEKVQYNINRAAAKISVFSSRKNDKCEFLFTYYPLRKAFKKQTKTIEQQRKKNKQMLLLI